MTDNELEMQSEEWSKAPGFLSAVYKSYEEIVAGQRNIKRCERER